MFAASAGGALLETCLYVIGGLYLAIRAGGGSGVPLVLSPLLWFLISVRIWVALRVAIFLTGGRGRAFYEGVAAIGLLLSFPFVAIVAMSIGSLYVYLWLPPLLTGFQILAARHVVRLQRMERSNSSDPVGLGSLSEAAADEPDKAGDERSRTTSIGAEVK